MKFHMISFFILSSSASGALAFLQREPIAVARHHHLGPEEAQFPFFEVKSSCSYRSKFTKLDASSPQSDRQRSVDNLLRMVEEISNNKCSPEVLTKMAELEEALVFFLEEEKSSGGFISPHPPRSPPPLSIFESNNYSNNGSEESTLIRAEEALIKLRERLRREEDALHRAEEALEMSIQEEAIILRAEQALQKSREAAAKRKQEAIRQSEQAMASAQKVRRESEQASQIWDQHQRRLMSVENNELERTDDSIGGTENVEKASMGGLDKKRATISLDSIGAVNEKALPLPPADPGTPQEFPSLFGWVQFIDGSINGRVRNSEKFADGASVFTSPVTQGVKGGTIIETSSGSKYYLERPVDFPHQINGGIPQGQINELAPSAISPDQDSSFAGMNSTARPLNRVVPENMRYQWGQQENGQSAVPKTARAPEGVPSILNWEFMDDGSICGLIFGSSYAEDGDYIETSPIASGILQSGYVVVTQSGSQYFLSPDEAEKAANSLAAFRDLAASQRGSTITIAKDNTIGNNDSRGLMSGQPEDAIATSKSSTPRSTFSLFDLFGAPPRVKVRTRQTSTWDLPDLGKTGPDGVPMLLQWSCNADGTITGIISGSPNLNDGDTVTTSPIVAGLIKRFQKVTTASGSVYYLG